MPHLGLPRVTVTAAIARSAATLLMHDRLQAIGGVGAQQRLLALNAAAPLQGDRLGACC